MKLSELFEAFTKPVMYPIGRNFEYAEDFIYSFAEKTKSACDIWLSSDQQEELFELYQEGKKISAKNFPLTSKQKNPERFEKDYAKIDDFVKSMKSAGFGVFSEEENDESKEIIFVQGHNLFEDSPVIARMHKERAKENKARVAAEKAKQKAEQAATSKTAERDQKLAQKRLEPIPFIGGSEIEKIFDRGGYNIGGSIEDVASRKPFIYTTAGDIEVAAVKLGLSLVIDLKNDLGYDDKTIETMYGGRDKVEEFVNVKIYRDPHKPSRLVGVF